LPAFWTLPTAFLSGAAAAAGIAVINSIGNLASFAGPLAMGWIKDHTGSYNGGLL
jgi:ACS family tartrate transporter-like MFS transporter